MLKCIEQVKRKNKYSTRDSVLNSTSLEEKPEKLKAEERYLAGGSKSINDWLPCPLAEVKHEPLTLCWLCTLRLHLIGANHSPALYLGLSAIAKIQFLPGTIHRSDINSPLATKTVDDRLEAPTVSTVFLRDPAIAAWWAKPRWGAQPGHCSPMAPRTLLTPQLFWASPSGALTLLTGGWLPATV